METALAGIAHDIRTPLTGIVALAELLAASHLGAREREWAQALKSGADHLTALTTLIVDAAKAEASGLTLRNDLFSPRAIAVAIGEILRARVNRRGLKVDIAIAPDFPSRAIGDALRLRSALENLADNAVKFTHDGAVAFTATAETAGRGRLRLVFTLSDTGIGMSAAEMKHLFRPFAQASEQIGLRYGGAGLGLTFVKRIAKAMGGDLTVSAKKGAGSTFKLTTSVRRAERVAAAERVGDTADGRPLTILCTEDNPYGRVVMNAILGEMGHRVDFAESGGAAVEAAATGNYDAVLMDIALPGFDGLEATRRIRALPGRRGQITVIGISGRGGKSDEAAALAAGMNFYFAKPVGPKELARTLAMIVK